MPRSAAMLAVALVCALHAACGVPPHAPPQLSPQAASSPAPPPAQAQLPQHEWLQQLVGEWDVDCEATMEPGAEPMLLESTESVRPFGGLWVLAEGEATFGGEEFSTMMTLGYDPAQERFVGTWIDTVQAYMWHYAGTLDETGKVLTLSTRGPSFDDTTDMADYRDAITVAGPDRRILTSSVKQDDGTWLTFMRAEYTRRR